MKKHHFVYKIVRFDGEFYIGRHSTNNLDDGYFGSGVILRRSVKKHGKDKHTFSILEHCTDLAEAVVRERELVNVATLADPLCMNLKLGGDGGWDHLTSDKEHQARAGKRGGAVGGKTGGKIGGKKTAAKNIKTYNLLLTFEERSRKSLMAGATQRANGTTLKGRKYMHRGAEQIVVRPEEVQSKLDEGFILGKCTCPRGHVIMVS